MQSRTRQLAPGALLATLLTSGACGPPVIHDTDLRPVRAPVLMASVPDGWLAVDTVNGAVRGVLELRVPTDAPTAHFLDLHVPRLRCESEGVHLPLRIRRDEPICYRSAAAPEDCRNGTGEPSRCRDGAMGPEPQCVRVVRAEFLFKELPSPTRELWLTFGQQATTVVWSGR